jgi:hypothetical protein
MYWYIFWKSCLCLGLPFSASVIAIVAVVVGLALQAFPPLAFWIGATIAGVLVIAEVGGLMILVCIKHENEQDKRRGPHA